MILVWFCALFFSLAARPVNASVARDVLVSHDQSSASSTASSPAFTTKSGGELLLAYVSTDAVSTPNITVQSVAGGGLTWVLVVRTNAQKGTSEIWRAFAPAVLTNVSVSAKLSQSVVSSIAVESFTGINVSGTNGSGAIGAVASTHATSGAPSASLTTTQSNSLVVGVANDYDAAVARTPLAGQTVVHQYLSSTGDTYWMQHVNAQTAVAGTKMTLGDSAPTSDQYNLSICEIVPAAVANPKMTLSATSLSFGNVTDGISKSLSVTLSSSGTTAVTISSLTLSGTGFSMASTTLPKTLNPGQTLAIPIAFAPTAAGSVTGKLTIVSNSTSGATSTVTLSGTGVAPVPQIAFSATSLSFGSVTTGTSKALSVTLTSSGTGSLTISSLSLSGTGFTMATTALPKTLTAGQSLAIPITFTPKAAGSVTGGLTVGSNSTTGATSTVALSGTGVTTSTQIAIAPTSLNFGSIADGTTKTMSVTLSSTGSSPLTINSTTVSGTGFSIAASTLPITLSTGQSFTVQVVFAPVTAGSLTGKLTVNSNSTKGSSTTMGLTGTGTATTNPKLTLSTTSLSLGTVTVGSSATQSVTLSSTGTSALTISSASVTGTGMSLVGATFPITLNAGTSTTLTVSYTPTTATSTTGQLTISSNSTLGTTSMVALSGTGAALTHSVDLSWNAPTSSTDPIAGYHVYRATSGNSAFALMNSSLVTATAYTDPTVASSTTYNYVVKSVDANGVESVASNAFSVTIP